MTLVGLAMPARIQRAPITATIMVLVPPMALVYATQTGEGRNVRIAWTVTCVAGAFVASASVQTDIMATTASTIIVKTAACTQTWIIMFSTRSALGMVTAPVWAVIATSDTADTTAQN